VLRIDSPQEEPWQSAISAARHNAASVYILPSTAIALPDKPAIPNGVAYVCVGTHCLAPVTAPRALAQRIREARTDLAAHAT
jgi:hypothetical protein